MSWSSLKQFSEPIAGFTFCAPLQSIFHFRTGLKQNWAPLCLQANNFTQLAVAKRLWLAPTLVTESWRTHWPRWQRSLCPSDKLMTRPVWKMGDSRTPGHQGGVFWDMGGTLCLKLCLFFFFTTVSAHDQRIQEQTHQFQRICHSCCVLAQNSSEQRWSKKFRHLFSLGLCYSDAEMLVCLCNFIHQYSLTPICGSIHKSFSSCASSKVFLNALSAMFLILCWLELVCIKYWQRKLRTFSVNHDVQQYYYPLLREKMQWFYLCLCVHMFVALTNYFLNQWMSFNDISKK